MKFYLKPIKLFTVIWGILVTSSRWKTRPSGIRNFLFRIDCTHHNMIKNIIDFPKTRPPPWGWTIRNFWLCLIEIEIFQVFLIETSDIYISKERERKGLSIEIFFEFPPFCFLAAILNFVKNTCFLLWASRSNEACGVSNESLEPQLQLKLEKFGEQGVFH